MSEPKPQLHLIVNPETGELIEQDDRDVLIDELKNDIAGARLQIGKLKREVRDLRSVEPEQQEIREILEYCNERWDKRYEIAPGGKYWAKVRERLKDKLDGRDPWTPAELKLAADGALLDPWLNGTDRRSKGYLKPDTVFRDPEQVQMLRDLAIGFDAKAGVPLGGLLDVADELRFVNWKHLLRVCCCGHRRVEHAVTDPNRGGEPCLEPGCYCVWFDEDACHPFNERGPT